MQKVKNILALIRWVNLLVILLCQLLVTYFIIDADFSTLDYRYVFLLLTSILIAAGGNVINDYYDVKIDAINKPQKLKVGHSINRINTIVFHQSLNVIALAMAFFISLEIFILDIVVIGLLWLYSWRLKCKPFIGNLIVSVLTAYVVYVLVLYFGEENRQTTAFAFFAFLLSMIREIVKDLQDMEGDEAFGCNTLPVSIGQARTKVILLVFAMFHILSVVFVLILSVNEYFKIGFIVLVLFPSVLFLVRLFKAKEKKDFERISTLVKIVMVGGLLTTIFL